METTEGYGGLIPSTLSTKRILGKLPTKILTVIIKKVNIFSHSDIVVFVVLHHKNFYSQYKNWTYKK